MKKNNLLLMTFLLSLLSCFSTGEPREPYDDSFYHNKQTHVSDEEYTRDSLYLVHTAKEFIRNEIRLFTHYNTSLKKYNDTNERKIYYDISINKIFYDSSKTKLYSYCVIGLTNKEHAKWSKDYKEFDGRNLSAFRDSLNEPWRVYPDDQIILSGAPTLDTLIEDLNYFYFTQLANQIENFVDKDGKYVDQPAGINLNNPNYWTEYPFWKKGSKGVDSLYGFQLKLDGVMGKERMKKLDYYMLKPKIDLVSYPDSLLKMYE